MTRYVTIPLPEVPRPVDLGEMLAAAAGKLRAEEQLAVGAMAAAVAELLDSTAAAAARPEPGIDDELLRSAVAAAWSMELGSSPDPDVTFDLRVHHALTVDELTRILRVAYDVFAAPALAIHAPRCARCIAPIDQCDGRDPWREGTCTEHDPTPECTVCVADWCCEATEPWPCPTARALGVQGPDSPGVTSR